jgi:hypothetical protein
MFYCVYDELALGFMGATYYWWQVLVFNMFKCSNNVMSESDAVLK